MPALTIKFADDKKQNHTNKLKYYEVQTMIKRRAIQSTSNLYKTSHMQLRIYLVTYNKNLLTQPANINITNLKLKEFTVLQP